MTLTDNEHITKAIARQLVKDSWTMETLATSHPRVLGKYKGVGMVTAGKIIAEAKRLVNQAKLNEAMRHHEAAPDKPTEEPAVSVRVRRIREQGQQ